MRVKSSGIKIKLFWSRIMNTALEILIINIVHSFIQDVNMQ